MNYFSKIKVGTWIVIVLTIINLASLATIFYKTRCNYNKDYRRENREQQKGRERGFHWKQLNLTEVQEEQFRAKGKQYFDSIKKIYKLRDTLAWQIVLELKKDNPNKEIMYGYTQQMGENYARSKMLTIDHLMKLKQLLREDQLQKLDSLYHFVLIGIEKPRPHRNMRKPSNDSMRIQK